MGGGGGGGGGVGSRLNRGHKPPGQVSDPNDCKGVPCHVNKINWHVFLINCKM